MREPDTRPGALWPVALLALLALWLCPPVFAEDPEPADPGADEAEEPPEPVPTAEAQRLAKLLDRAAKRRKAADVLPVLEELANRSHASFVKPLSKMLKHESSKVALAAADALQAQRPANEKDRKKLLKAIWKTGWHDRANKRRYVVQGRIPLIEGTITKKPIDEKSFKEVKRMWARVLGDPKERYAPALISVCEYVALVKDKRFCRLLAEEIDDPTAADIAVNSPSNPPREWWERRWKMWKPMKAPVVEALEELTGQSFKSTKVAKEWFKENEKEFGFSW